MNTPEKDPDQGRRVLIVIIAVVVLLAAVGGLVYATSDSGDDSQSDSTEQADDAATSDDADDDPAADAELDSEVAKRAGKYDAPPKLKLDSDKTYTATVDTTEGTFTINIDQKAGPIAAANFVFLAKDNFYQGVTVHRIVPGFVIQMGDPLGNGTGGPGYTIKDDPITEPYQRGTVAMANSGPDTGGSQFFIVLSDDAQFEDLYSIFGTVDSDGMEVVDDIAALAGEADPFGGEPTLERTIRINDISIDEN